MGKPSLPQSWLMRANNTARSCILASKAGVPTAPNSPESSCTNLAEIWSTNLVNSWWACATVNWFTGTWFAIVFNVNFEYLEREPKTRPNTSKKQSQLTSRVRRSVNHTIRNQRFGIGSNISSATGVHETAYRQRSKRCRHHWYLQGTCTKTGTDHCILDQWGTVPYAPSLRKIAPCTCVPKTKSLKTRHEAVYIE